MLMPMCHPFTALVAGPTGSGKSTFVFKLIENVDFAISPPPSRIVYCYCEYQPAFDAYPHVDF